MNAAQAFGMSYREATRKPGDPARRYSYKSDEDEGMRPHGAALTRIRGDEEEDEDEVRRPRPGMRPLGDQGEDEEESEGEAALQFECPSCGEITRLALPEGWTVADGEDEEEAEGRGQRMATRCDECGEVLHVAPPAGTRFTRKATEAATAFSRRYRRQIFESALRHRGLPIT